MLCIFIAPELELEGSDDLPKVTQGLGSRFGKGIHTCKAPSKAAFLLLLLCIFSYFPQDHMSRKVLSQDAGIPMWW